MKVIRTFILLICSLYFGHVVAADFPHTIAAVKPSIVRIGSHQITRSPAISYVGTGFIVGDGLTVITNAHVLQGTSNIDKGEGHGIIVGQGGATEFRLAKIIAVDTEHDLAKLSISGMPLPALTLGDSDQVVEGQAFAFTGFPLTMALGMQHVSHRATVSALTPVVMPAVDAQKLDVKMIAQLRRSSYTVFQLDATAFPGNSGSPLYDPKTGVVYGVINSVFIKGIKESAITNPSGITYAIPGKYVRSLLQATP